MITRSDIERLRIEAPEGAFTAKGWNHALHAVLELMGDAERNSTTPAPVVPAEGLDALVEGWDNLKDSLPNDGHAAAELLFDYGDKLADAITALRSAPPVGAQVKPLTWHKIGTFGGDCYDASATGVVYRIVPKADGTFWLTAPSTITATLEAAKAAAQADYEARILAALLPAGEGE